MPCSRAQCYVFLEMNALVTLNNVWNSEEDSVLVRPYIVALVCAKICLALICILGICETRTFQ